MKVTGTLEQRYDRTPDGATWTSAQFPYEHWARFLEVFDEVRVLARVREVDSVPEQFKRADGENVTISPVPYYLGPYQYLKQRSKLLKVIKESVTLDHAYILRIASQVGNLVQPILEKNNFPYGVQVVCDPYDAFAPGAVKHPFSAVFRCIFPRRLKKQCAGATAAAYVTNQHLQSRYPCPGHTTMVTDVQLTDEAFVDSPRSFPGDKKSFSLVFVGSLAQMYKAPDLLIQAIASCVKDGLDLKLVMIGDGKFRPKMEALAEAEGVSNYVTFAGQLSNASAVRSHLDQADLLIHPSRTEGLPRAVIEAMARALPCIGSTAGGIPELLDEEDLFPPGSAPAIADKIKEVLSSPKRLEAMSERNLRNSNEYKIEIMVERKREFFRYVKDITSERLKKRSL